MKYSYKITSLRALNRFNRSCQNNRVKYFTIKLGGDTWRAESDILPPLRNWDDIEVFTIKEV